MKINRGEKGNGHCGLSLTSRHTFACAALLVLVFAGRFAPGPNYWGFNHLAYLPWPVFVLWCVLASVSLVPAIQNRLGIILHRFVDRWLFGKLQMRLVVAVAGVGLFTVFREQSFFMGDGYLIVDLIQKEIPFRIFDNMDYYLHFRIWKYISQDLMSITALYSFGSIAAGLLAFLLLVTLIRRFDWQPWRRGVALGLVFFCGPGMLFFGYIESYSFLYTMISCFVVCGLLVVEGRLPLWVASSCFGVGLFFHLTAVFSAPALLYLVARADNRPVARRILEGFVPVLAL